MRCLFLQLWNSVGEFCVHGNEAFPGWHRAYLLEFERVMRCADMALGGDGMIGLPYWGWEEVYINDEVRTQLLVSLLMLKIIMLPRQARDKHRESTQKRLFSRRPFRRLCASVFLSTLTICSQTM
jgi:hypothetical protein